MGLAVVALLAAAMSSLDSVINSLSATTLKDFIKPMMAHRIVTPEQELQWGRALTIFWGLFALLTAFYVDDIASTVIVAVNKVGSLINGPILGVFMLGLFTKSVTGGGARLGFVAGAFDKCTLEVGAGRVLALVERHWFGCDLGRVFVSAG